METDVTIEKELSRKPPRRIVNRSGKWGVIAPWLFLLLPHFWIAVIAPFGWLAFVIDTFGAGPIQAKVVAHHTTHKKSKTTYSIAFETDLNNKIRRSSTSVDQTQYESIKDGDTMTVYGLSWLPWLAPRLERDSIQRLPALAFLSFWCLLWCGITFSIVFAMLDQPLRSKYLTKYGTPLLGTLTEIQLKKGKNSDTYKLLYEYEAKTIDRKTGKKVTGKFKGIMSLRTGDYSTADALTGHPVTVLINEKKPQQSILYKFCDYKVIG